jgi:hypothetical protein
VEALNPLVTQAQELLELDPMQLAPMLGGINSLNAHVAQHVEFLSQDPQMRSESAMFRQVLQNADEILHNGTLKVQRLMSQQQQQQTMTQGGAGQEQEQPQIDPAVLAKIDSERAVRQAKLEMDMQTHQQKMIMRQQEASQKLALRDAEVASKIQTQGIRA